jgi:hypothetical protein
MFQKLLLRNYRLIATFSAINSKPFISWYVYERFEIIAVKYEMDVYVYTIHECMYILCIFDNKQTCCLSFLFKLEPFVCIYVYFIYDVTYKTYITFTPDILCWANMSNYLQRVQYIHNFRTPLNKRFLSNY